MSPQQRPVHGPRRESQTARGNDAYRFSPDGRSAFQTPVLRTSNSVPPSTGVADYLHSLTSRSQSHQPLTGWMKSIAKPDADESHVRGLAVLFTVTGR